MTVAADGPLLSFAKDRFRGVQARRGRRHPLGAHGGAVSASLRLHCGARPGVASHNSLRSLRSLRSDKCAESDHEARYARRPRACAPRRPTNRPQRIPPAALNRWFVFDREQPMPPQRRGRAGRRSAPERRREAQGSWPRAQRASLTDSAHLSERSERSERSELCDGPRARCTEPGHEQSCGLFVPGEGQGLWPWPQGSRSEAETASPKRCGGLPAPAFAVPTSAPERGQRLSAMGRKRTSPNHPQTRRRLPA